MDSSSFGRTSATTGEGSNAVDGDMRQSTTRSVSSASNSIRSNQKTLSFFQTLMRKRSTDYHGDTVHLPSASRGITASRYSQNTCAPPSQPPLVSAERAMYEADETQPQEIRPPTCWQSFCFRITIPSYVRQNFCERLISSRTWRITFTLFTIALIFGAQIRDLFCPKAADDIFDIAFLVIIGFFAVDILMRVDVEPNYFVFRAFGRGQSTFEESTTCLDLQLGSFIFWCELCSTLALLFEISLINQRDFEMQTVDIRLNTFGTPIEGMQQVNEATPVEYREIDLLITIAKTARIARFIRSSTAVKISSKVNWYNLVNPFWWCGCFLPRRQSEDEACNETSSNVFSRSPQARNTDYGIGGYEHVVAATRAREEERQERNAHPFRAFLKSLGFFPNKNEDLRRHIAAVKIQRAWRRVLAQRLLDDEGYETAGEVGSYSNHDWKGRSSASISTRGRSAGPADPNRASGGVIPVRRIGGDVPMNASRKRKESQVGSAMRELTGQRVAIGILVSLVMTVLFTYTENDATRPATMIILHKQTSNELFADRSLEAARSSSIPDLFRYQFSESSGGRLVNFEVNGEDTKTTQLRDREMLRITVEGSDGEKTSGWFTLQNELKQEAVVELMSTFFIILVWFFGVTGFAGPVMILVVIPIERMVSLLEMLMRDPLGYQNSARYRRFVAEEKEITKNTRWTKEVLKGMETSFLMHTILRIGSLMKVGFGSAGVEIIRNNLEGRNKSMLTLSGKGSTVSCIFLFCDIRQFTDATECLQEEVFVFTNKIAAVVHSICNSYGGSANKNIGDAFLLSWRLDDQTEEERGPFRSKSSGFTAKSNQADKALLSVVKINMALYYDEYYLETMSDAAREALLTKLTKRKGPVVQLGFGLHAGKAVQGSIGSQRKIDATYVSEAVERAEFLESSTKKYGVKMLMSDDFHRLLHPNNRRRCRKIDQIIIKNDDEDDDEDELSGDTMELYTFDMDIEALWKKTVINNSNRVKLEIESDSGESQERHSKRDLRAQSNRQLLGNRRRSIRHKDYNITDESSDLGLKAHGVVGVGVVPPPSQGEEVGMPEKLVLPTGPALYNAKVWVDRNMHEIRRIYTDGIFLQKFNAGLQAFYSKDWETAKQCFTTCVEKIEDGPSKYFVAQIEKNGGKPPRNFLGYGIA
mmetsp:Transcript_1762/g.3417  ORF Transcript_1762/g.3417 Transcript_1762/m.3417 type:complete len:1158 (-) Transcript_1762:1419-4892(-)